MKKSLFKKLIMECVIEVMNEVGGSNRIKQKYFADSVDGYAKAMEFALEKCKSLERVKVVFRTNHGWHSRQTNPIVKYGPAIRNPDTEEVIKRKLSKDAYDREQQYRSKLYHMMKYGEYN